MSGALILVLLVLAIALAWDQVPSELRFGVTAATGLAAACVAVWPLLWVARHGEHFALWLLAAMAPLACAPLVPLARTLHWLEYAGWISYAVPAASALTVTLVFLLLTERAQAQRDRKRRLARLDQIDASTGLVNDAVFMQRLENMLVRSRRMGHESLVVLLEVSNHTRLRGSHSRRQVQSLMVRLAARLSSFVRPSDTVARLSDARFGLIFEGPVPAERSRLTSMATKILTQCMNAQGGLPQTLSAQIRMGVVLVPNQAETAEAALAQLERVVLGADPEGKRSIFYVDSRPPGPIHEAGMESSPHVTS